MAGFHQITGRYHREAGPVLTQVTEVQGMFLQQPNMIEDKPVVSFKLSVSQCSYLGNRRGLDRACSTEVVTEKLHQ